MQKVPVPRLELTHTHIGLAVLPGPFCLVTFRIRSGKGNADGKPHKAISGAYLTAPRISGTLRPAPAESDYQGGSSWERGSG
jgi:hypothetical protein